ncbi:hypothetical protein BDV96DRAFT_653694 [Lophiotrema nucula]|uniref:Uncharacterized protein n=1 Tax=Lophiotrema nucula TaxID=690887 RepID=A0A6A5YK42_9PLEO|nr:hypothetical protein BDV96DRAFT_653694 [Lophiotrema nucula]
MLFVLAIVVLIRSAASTSTVETTGWTSAPNFRGTWDILVSCVLTLAICVWSALHLNVPTADSTLAQRNLRRTRWILLGIFAPEWVVSTAFAQYLTAKWLRREISEDNRHRKGQGSNTSFDDADPQDWSITTCYFATMGGFTVQTGDGLFDRSPRLSLTPEGIRLLSFLGRLPQVKERHIRDKSKADGLAKSIVCLQAGWMILQTIARLAQHLPVTLLEINTIGHVLCALVLYLLWWSKPLEVKDPITLPREEWMDSYLALMWMCSPISSCDGDGISEIRCMVYTTPLERRNLSASAPTITISEEHSEADNALRPHETHFSIGSRAARDPMKFIGPLGDFRVGSQIRSPSPTPFDHHVSYKIQDKTVQTAPEHEVFFQLQELHHGLQHTRQYCRRALRDCRNHEPLSHFAIQRWRLACAAIDDLWHQCEERPGYSDFYFTTSSLGTFVGETSYIERRMPNFLGLSYLGGVNVHKDRLKSVLAFVAAAYGALHIAAWNEYYPTKVERLLWIVSSMAIGSSGIALWCFFLAKQSIESFDIFGTLWSRSKAFSIIGRFVFLPLFVLARIYLVVEAFVSLRKAPIAVYQTPEWSEFLPHL